MATSASPLHPLTLKSGVPVSCIPPKTLEKVTPDSPARSVMTDLNEIAVVTIAPDDPVDFALQVMLHSRVRMLVVVDRGGRVCGLVTAADLMGERPINVTQRERIEHVWVQVQDVMTPIESINPLDIHEVEQARVRDVVAVMRERGKQHLLVVETDADGERYVVRGIFSASQLARQLGIVVDPMHAAMSFAELEQILIGERDVA